MCCSGAGTAKKSDGRLQPVLEWTLISPSVLPRGFSISLLQLASPWGLGRTFGDSEGLAGGWGWGQAPLSKQDLANHILSTVGCGWGGREDPRRGFAAVGSKDATARIPDELSGADLLCLQLKADFNASKKPGGVRSPLQL